jgi:hypothetical protein
MSAGLRWLLFGLLGLLVAGAVAFLAIQTVSEKIGISSESPAAGSALAPRPKAVARKKRRDEPDAASNTAAATTVQSQPAPAPGEAGGDDYAGGGEADGGGGDD